MSVHRLLAKSSLLTTAFYAAAWGRSTMAIESVYPERTWTTTAPAAIGMDAALLAKARDYALTGGGSGCVIRHGRWVFSWGDSKQRYDLKSSTKSIGVTALLLAVADGKMHLADEASKYHPALGIPPEENRKTGWLDEITLFHLATQTAGFAKPGGYVEMLYEPGTKWSYSDAGPNWLAECITLAYRRDLRDLLFERVFTPLGIRPDDLQWRDNAYRPHEIEGIPRRELGSGIHANVDAMARIGLLYLWGGRWKEKQIIPEELVGQVGRTPGAVRGLPVLEHEKYAGASNHYGLLWWNNNDGTLKNVPRDAYWSWGLFDSFIVVIPSLDIVVARAGESFKGEFASHYDRLVPFLEPIAESAGQSSTRPSAEKLEPPYPPSSVIPGLMWAPKETIRRAAEGSDNWPMTWADDDRQYTAYGDGWGFEPKTREKLSLGVACVEGGPEDFRGVNIRTASGEQLGDGASGKKASGMLCVDGVLYMWVRNARNSQLAWSADHGRTWQWTDWRFTTSFGCPTFLNYGRNYSGARDAYVYVYSFDSETAYVPASRMVLARVPKDRIREQDAYEFYVRLDQKGQPVWSRSIADRGAVFEHPARCYRSGISYDAGLKRYLWSQIIPGGDTRKQGGFGVYDAPEPWGPWTTVYFTEDWDVGPGESSSFPTKWMSQDGLTLHLIFSGNDHFSVRKVTFLPAVGVHGPSTRAGIDNPMSRDLVAFDPPWSSPFHVDPDRPFQLINSEGRHLFILNKTAWAYFLCKDPQGVLDRAAAQGVNVLRVALEGAPYYEALKIDMWPWKGTRREPDFTVFNERYWDQVEQRVRLAGQKGIGLDIVLYSKYYPRTEQIEQQRAYWQQVLRRLGRYANVLTWEIANEYTSNEAFQDAAGTFLRRNDPYHRPVCTSAGTTDDAVWPDKPWMSLAINHTCTSSKMDLRDWYLAVARNTRGHGKPAFCNESGREKRHRNDDAVHRRKQGWLWCSAGAFWTYHSWEGCEGIDDAKYRGPASEFNRPLADYFRSMEFWELNPNHTALQFANESLVTAVLASASRRLVSAYCCTPQTGRKISGAEASVRLPDGRYVVEFLRPADLELLGTCSIESRGVHKAVDLEIPAFTDDVVVRVRMDKVATATTMPGTE
jgi:CubicO group peptidase (beta-lactamase class C family)